MSEEKHISEWLAEWASPEGQRETRRAEQAFRRGYSHAYLHCLDAFAALGRQGYTIQEAEAALNDFYNERILDEWRNQDQGFEPPVFQIPRRIA